MATNRSGRPRRRTIAHTRATQPNCWLCGYPVDLTLHRGPVKPHPLSHCTDEVIPVIRGGSDTDPTNCRTAHRCCNGSRHDHPMVPQDPGWPQRTHEPEEIRTRCRHLAQHHMHHKTITITW